MTRANVANPRRTTLASLDRGSDLAGCTGTSTCRNVAVRVVEDERGRRLLCRTCD